MFIFEAEYWDEVETKNNYDSGMCDDDNYADAINSILSFYGKENIISVKLTELEHIICENEIKDIFGDTNNG